MVIPKGILRSKKRILTLLVLIMSMIIFSTLFKTALNSSLHERSEFDIDPRDRLWMTKFFKDLMLAEGGAYVIWGTKPLIFAQCDIISDEEIQAWINSFSDEEKKGLTFHEEPYDLPENWDKWSQLSAQFPMTNYLLFKAPIQSEPDNPKRACVYLVNILQTALTIEKHKELFKQRVDFEFHPLEIVYDIVNRDSKFWTKIWDDSLLTGLLLGFGERNSWGFQWKCSDGELSTEQAIKFINGLQTTLSVKEKYKSFSIKQFPIPYFISFFREGEDPMIQQYQAERAKIQNIYRGQDFLELTLKRLISRDL